MIKQWAMFFGIFIFCQLFAGKAPRPSAAQKREVFARGRVVRLRERHQGNQQNNVLVANVLAIIAERAVGGGVIASHGAGSEKPST